jgi:hypothetical protein
MPYDEFVAVDVRPTAGRTGSPGALVFDFSVAPAISARSLF